MVYMTAELRKCNCSLNLSDEDCKRLHRLEAEADYFRQFDGGLVELEFEPIEVPIDFSSFIFPVRLLLLAYREMRRRERPTEPDAPDR